MITLDIEQHTEEWYSARRGIPTASGFSKIVTSKGEPSKQAKKYMYQLAGERVAGSSEEGFKSLYMNRGNEVEAEARAYYELITGNTVKQVGVVYKNDEKLFSCSPDGLVADEGGIQIKCPSMAVHVEYLINGKLPTDYFVQMQGELFVTERKWWDFVSYYPCLNPLIIRVERDDSFISKFEPELIKFCKELDIVTEKIR